MKKLLLLTFLSGASLFGSEDMAPVIDAIMSNGRSMCMDFSLLSINTADALAQLSLKTKQIVEDVALQNPKTTSIALGTGALSFAVYKGVSYISTIDPKTAGSTALMGYGALRMLVDTKNVLKSMLCAVEQEESKIRAEVIIDEFYEIQSAQEEIEANKNKCKMTPEKRKAIFIQLQNNRLHSIGIFENQANN